MSFFNRLGGLILVGLTAATAGYCGRMGDAVATDQIRKQNENKRKKQQESEEDEEGNEE
jgi:hypothetical protein